MGNHEIKIEIVVNYREGFLLIAVYLYNLPAVVA
jgi:hypothetical protein